MAKENKPLNLVFMLEKTGDAVNLKDIVHEEDVNFYPNLQIGDLIDINRYDMEETGPVETQKYRVVRIQFEVNVNTGKNYKDANIFSLLVYLEEIPDEPDGGFDIVTLYTPD